MREAPSTVKHHEIVELVSFETEQRELLEHAHSVGVVLDYARVIAPEAETIEHLHRQALLLGLEEVARRRRLNPEIRSPGPTGGPVSTEQLYGWHFDIGSRRLRLPARGDYAAPWRDLYQSQSGVKGSMDLELGYGPYRWADDDDPNNAIWIRDSIVCAYAHAFIDPPYPIQGLSPVELQDLFLRVDDRILNQPGDGAEIWWWNGGTWADYFLPGLEWWGAWSATVRISSTELVVIAASSSD